MLSVISSLCVCFFFNVTATTYIYTYGHTLALHDALPIFDMISLALALVLHRIDDDPEQGLAGVQLTELFVNDMDGQMRQIGFGDMVVGKQVGRMMSALGGRLGAYRAADGTAELREIGRAHV